MSEEALIKLMPFGLSSELTAHQGVVVPLRLAESESRIRSFLLHDEDEFVVSPVDQLRNDLFDDLKGWFSEGSLSYWKLYRASITQQATMILAVQAATRALIELRRQNPAQLKLPMAGDFSPSKSLVEIWRESVLALASEAGAEDSVASHLDVAQEFGKLLKAFLGSMGQDFRYSKETREAPISQAGRFVPSVQIALCDHFLILPDQSAEFLSLLYVELKKALEEGILIKGAWGSLTVKSNELCYSLSAPEFISTPGFRKAREIR